GLSAGAMARSTARRVMRNEGVDDGAHRNDRFTPSTGPSAQCLRRRACLSPAMGAGGQRVGSGAVMEVVAYQLSPCGGELGVRGLPGRRLGSVVMGGGSPPATTPV